MSGLLAKVCGRKCEHLSHMIPPHNLQWWRRLVSEKLRPQSGHACTYLSGIHGTTCFSKARKNIEIHYSTSQFYLKFNILLISK